MSSGENSGVKIYKNTDVEEIVIAIPDNHVHVRLLIKFKDQSILINEAVIAAIVRGYLSIALDPVRRGIVFKQVVFSKDSVKRGYDTVQLIEIPDSEKQAVETITSIVEKTS
ncbi:MAG: hypothetical protein QW607_01005 [Desulfurococcaceae archaeon]